MSGPTSRLSPVPFPAHDAIVQRLSDEFGYSDLDADALALELAELPGPLAGAFAKWWRTSQKPDLEVRGYTLARIMQETGETAPAAFVALGRLSQEKDDGFEAGKYLSLLMAFFTGRQEFIVRFGLQALPFLLALIFVVLGHEKVAVFLLMVVLVASRLYINSLQKKLRQEERR